MLQAFRFFNYFYFIDLFDKEKAGNRVQVTALTCAFWHGKFIVECWSVLGDIGQ
jgi:hypothetical protein